MKRYKLTRLDTGSTWFYRTYSKALNAATIIRNTIIRNTNGMLKPRFKVEEI